MTNWEIWVAGVIAGIGEPLTQTSVDTHWAWSNAETAPYDLMRWNNPQNTTEKWFNSRDSGAQPGPRDVQIYRSIQDGIDATVATLLNGIYPAIVANLRGGVAHQQWGAFSAAGAELHAWGTGTNWLQATYGPAPGNLAITIPKEVEMLRIQAPNGSVYLLSGSLLLPVPDPGDNNNLAAAGVPIAALDQPFIDGMVAAAKALVPISTVGSASYALELTGTAKSA